MASRSLAASVTTMPHFDLEMTGEEILRVIDRSGHKMLADRELDMVLRFGKRNLDWLKHINSRRDAKNQLTFSSPETQPANPIETPRAYNRSIVLSDYGKLVAELPAEMKAVLIDNQPFTDNPPISDESYVAWGHKANKVYDITARWVMMQPYLSELEARKRDDIRGYYFLSREPKLEVSLREFNRLDMATRDRLAGYLVNLCQNTHPTGNRCKQDLNQAVQANRVYNFYLTYVGRSQRTWYSFFRLDIKRDDSRWSANVLTVPFLDPRRNDLIQFLLNIEDEWRWKGWQLKLDFKNTGEDIPHLEFEAGATPHVDGLGGNTITMDANEPLTEYNVRWTIRHEWGHVLGFPDCYVEFYDSEKKWIVSYQLDITNLMCSRRGKLQEKHVQELRRVYGAVR